MPAIQRFVGGAPNGTPGVVDQDVDAAVAFGHGLDELVDGIQVGQVTGDGVGLAAVSGDAGRDLGQ